MFAQWFDKEALLAAYTASGSPKPWEKRTLPAPPDLCEAHGLPEGQRKLSTQTCSWLTTYAVGKGLAAQTIKAPGKETVFFGGGEGA